MAETPNKATNPYGLTDLQWRFVSEYVVDFNGTQAAKRAGIERHHDKRASLFLKVPAIRNALHDMLEERNQRWENTHSRVIQEAMNLAYSNLLDYATWTETGMRIIPSSKLTRDQGASIMSIEQVDTEHGRHLKVKREPKSKAIELLMRNLGILDQDKSDDSTRGIFAKWAENQRAQAVEEEERDKLREEIEELKKVVAQLKGAIKREDGSDGEGQGSKQ